MTSNQITVMAVGDLFIRDENAAGFFASTAPVLRSADVTFGNCEQPYAAHYPGVVAHLADAGFDVLSLANNHILDYGNNAFLETIELVRDHGMLVVGGGPTITAARAPVVIERGGVTVAFLAYSSIQVPSYQAGIDRPGCAPIRVRTGYREQFEEWPGYPPRILTEAYPEDVAAMREDIASVRERADAVAVSLHYGPLLTRSVLADYQKAVSRAAIDAGADVVLGHHPHIMKGIEVYRGRPIFYSLGNFVMKTHAPVSDHYDSGGGAVTSEVVRLNKRTWPTEFGYDPAYPLFPFAPNRDTLKSGIVKLDVDCSGITRVAFLPCLIDTGYQPELLPASDSRFGEVVSFLRASSDEEDLSVNLRVDAEEVVVLPRAGQLQPAP